MYSFLETTNKELFQVTRTNDEYYLYRHSEIVLRNVQTMEIDKSSATERHYKSCIK